MKSLSAAACAFAITLSSLGCGNSSNSGGIDSLAQVTAPVDGQEFTLHQGDSVQLAGSHSTLHFLAVPEDSRCPSGVQCIWAGNARASLKLDATQFDLNTTVEPLEATVAGYHFQLVRLTPRPEGDTVSGKYSATLKVTR